MPPDLKPSVSKFPKRSRLLAGGLVAVVAMSLLHAPAAHAAELTPDTPRSAESAPAVPVQVIKPQQTSSVDQSRPASKHPTPQWPRASSIVTDVVAARGTAHADGSTVRLSEPSSAGTARSASSVPSRVRVEVLDRTITNRTGQSGVLLRLSRADGVAVPGPARISVNYGSFATAYGADWSSRLRLVSLPSCALVTPAKQGCGATPLSSRNDLKTRTVSADVSVGGEQTLVAASAAPAGPAGDYSATSLTPSATWTAGGNSGAFNWSYPMRLPPSIGGPQPTLGLSYSSQSVDGQHAASNNQPSWVGQGFDDSSAGFIERRYRPCALDMDGSANNDKKTGDLCWETDNATLSLPGHTGELIFNAGEGRWHLRNDDGSRIERRTGAKNDDDDGEHWVLTTPDGVQYWFGSQRLPGWTTGDSVTNSTLTVPVFGNDPVEPCHAAAFADSSCTQGWRWNLDYVVDLTGNSVSYWYQKETNKYARNLKAEDDAPYDRAAWLDRIDYGTRQINGVDSALNTTAPMRADFVVDDRCLSNCGTHDAVHWPDVPWDTSCAADSCANKFSPTFWSTKRLSSLTTQVKKGTAYSNVERWTFAHTFPDPGDGTRAGLWLSKISHEGLVGGMQTVPDVEFTWTQMANRVDTIDFAAAMKWMRIARIRTETGGSISVVYSEQDCKADQPRPTPEANDRLCYPVRWIPEGYENPVTDWFNKYVVTTIYQNDNTGGMPPAGSERIVYSYKYFDGAGWHYTDDDGLVQNKYKTWSDYRGYGRVGVTVGDPGEQTYTETQYFRGMHGDRLNTGGGTRSVAVGGVADEDWFAGMTRESKVLNGPTGAAVTREVNTPWGSDATASRTIDGDTVTARFTGYGTVAKHTALDSGRSERVLKTVTAFDSYGLPEKVDDLGVDGTPGDERCVKYDYTPRNLDAWLTNKVHRVQKYAVKCGDTSGTLTADDVIGETRTSFDDLPFESTPAKGLETQVAEMADWKNGTPSFTTVEKASYDIHGRVKSSWDELNQLTTTAYTPAADGAVTSTVSTNSLGHTTTRTLEPSWGLETSVVDPNEKRTIFKYDPRGYLTEAWAPGRDKAVAKYSYDIRADRPSVITTSRLNSAGAYTTSYELFDGLARSRETQSPSPSGGRIVSEKFYDTVGRPSRTFDGYHAAGEPSSILLSATDKAFVLRQNRTVYDGAGRVSAQIFEPIGVERWRTGIAYAGDRIDVTPPAGGTATSTVADVRGETIALRQYQGPTPTPGVAGSWDSTNYQYDRRGYLIKVADAMGNDWNYTYDARGRKVQIDDPDKGLTALTYDNAGNVLTSTDARGEKIAYLYDTLGRKRAAFDDQINGAIRAQWRYDQVAKGHLDQSTRVVGSATYQIKIIDYDDDYQPKNTQVVIPALETGLAGTYNFNRTYNADGSIASATMPATNSDLPAETLTYQYTSLGQPFGLKSLYGTTNLSYVSDTDYNALGELDQIDRHTGTGGHVYTKFDHDQATGRLNGIRTVRDVAQPNLLMNSRYEHDAIGNVVKAIGEAGGVATDTQCFAYDNLRRLTQAWTPSADECAAAPNAATLGGPAPYWHTWEFDRIGNRTKETVHQAVGDNITDYDYPDSGATSVRPHALTSTSGSRSGSYTYDNTGNMLSRPSPAGTQAMSWDPEGRLGSSTDAAGNSTYVYDADGERLIRRDNTGRTLYLDGQEIRFTTSTSTKSATRYYSFADNTIASRTASGLTWLANDHQSTAVVAVDADTQQASIRRQTPYGTTRGNSPTWPNDKGFVGGTKDPTGLTHLGAREYDPEIGRFISVDPLQDLSDPQQWNSYAYANNSPITNADPSGQIFADIFDPGTPRSQKTQKWDDYRRENGTHSTSRNSRDGEFPRSKTTLYGSGAVYDANGKLKASDNTFRSGGGLVPGESGQAQQHVEGRVVRWFEKHGVIKEGDTLIIRVSKNVPPCPSICDPLLKKVADRLGIRIAYIMDDGSMLEEGIKNGKLPKNVNGDLAPKPRGEVKYPTSRPPLKAAPSAAAISNKTSSYVPGNTAGGGGTSIIGRTGTGLSGAGGSRTCCGRFPNIG